MVQRVHDRERPEQLGSDLGLESAAMVEHDDPHPIGRGGHLDLHGRPLRRELDGVLDQRAQDALCGRRRHPHLTGIGELRDHARDLRARELVYPARAHHLGPVGDLVRLDPPHPAPAEVVESGGDEGVEPTVSVLDDPSELLPILGPQRPLEKSDRRQGAQGSA